MHSVIDLFSPTGDALEDINKKCRDAIKYVEDLYGDDLGGKTLTVDDVKHLESKKLEFMLVRSLLDKDGNEIYGCVPYLSFSPEISIDYDAFIYLKEQFNAANKKENSDE